MNKKKVLFVRKNWLPYTLKAPLALLIVSSFVASVYAAVTGLMEIKVGTPIFFGVIIGLYILGVWLGKKQKASS